MLMMMMMMIVTLCSNYSDDDHHHDDCLGHQSHQFGYSCQYGYACCYYACYSCAALWLMHELVWNRKHLECLWVARLKRMVEPK